MEPVAEDLLPDDCIMVCNYFGLKSYDFYERMSRRYKNIIFDNTQAFYAKPILKENIYNVYSPRKFVGVPDGGYLIGLRIKGINIELKQDSSYDTSLYLLKSLEYGQNEAYEEYLRNEERILKSGMMWMSSLTKKLLTTPDYDRLKAKRLENYKILEGLLGAYNLIDTRIIDNDTVPFVYPFLTNKNRSSLRKYLVGKKIYVSQWWKAVIEKDSTTYERDLSECLYPLPIDQRYTEKDMKEIASIVIEGLK